MKNYKPKIKEKNDLFEIELSSTIDFYKNLIRIAKIKYKKEMIKNRELKDRLLVYPDFLYNSFKEINELKSKVKYLEGLKKPKTLDIEKI